GVSRRLPLRALNSISQLVPPKLHTRASGMTVVKMMRLLRSIESLTCLSPDVGRSKYQPSFVFQSTVLVLVTRVPLDTANTVCATKSLRVIRDGFCASLSHIP